MLLRGLNRADLVALFLVLVLRIVQRAVAASRGLRKNSFSEADFAQRTRNQHHIVTWREVKGEGEGGWRNSTQFRIQRCICRVRSAEMAKHGPAIFRSLVRWASKTNRLLHALIAVTCVRQRRSTRVIFEAVEILHSWKDGLNLARKQRDIVI